MAKLTTEQFEQEVGHCLAVHLTGRLLHEGVIGLGDFERIRSQLAARYQFARTPAEADAPLIHRRQRRSSAKSQQNNQTDQQIGLDSSSKESKDV